jgi:hypothetical protein
MPIGPSTSTAPYLTSSSPTVQFYSILTAGDALPADGVFGGVPDGLAAYANLDGTITVLVSHQLGGGQGILRDSGAKGSYIDKLVIDPNTLQVISAGDLITSTFLWQSGHYVQSTYAFRSFACNDLTPEAFYNSATGLGTQTHFLLQGEEAGSETGRPFAIMVDGPNAGVAYELPYLGNMTFEAMNASPYQQDKTIVALTDDVVGGQVYFYVGQKQSTGSDIDKAGLSGGELYGVHVDGVLNEVEGSAVTGTFSLAPIGTNGDVHKMAGSAIETASDNAGVTGFLRPEDSAWDPDQPNVLYFVTTDTFSGHSRLYQLTFTDITHPELGGVISCLLDGTEGYHSLDNISVSNGKIILQEDPGSTAYVANMWQYDIATDSLTQLAAFNTSQFKPNASNFITKNEESSGVIDVTSLFQGSSLIASGSSVYLADAQVHKATNDPSTVEMGQLMLMVVNPSAGTAAQLSSSSLERSSSVPAAHADNSGLSGDDFVFPATGFSGRAAGDMHRLVSFHEQARIDHFLELAAGSSAPEATEPNALTLSPAFVTQHEDHSAHVILPHDLLGN